MAALEIQGNGDSGVLVTDEHIAKTIDALENAQQKNFISKCLQLQPDDRASARELLFHPLLFEVHSLKLLAAHSLVNTARKLNYFFPFIRWWIKEYPFPNVSPISFINKKNRFIKFFKIRFWLNFVSSSHAYKLGEQKKLHGESGECGSNLYCSSSSFLRMFSMQK